MNKEENNSDIIIKDFVGIFPNSASEEYCDKIINRFDYLQKREDEGRGKIWTRQEAENNIPSILKENDTYFLGSVKDDRLLLKGEEKILLDYDLPLLQEFNEILWNCYDKYAKKYGMVKSLSLHKLAASVRVQKYKPSQGYHLWHCDGDGLLPSRRVMAVTLYLNTVKEGGETEFLYQRMRIPPEQGTIAIFPTGWTHTHRGNPPLKGNKYIITTWLDFTE